MSKVYEQLSKLSNKDITSFYQGGHGGKPAGEKVLGTISGQGGTNEHHAPSEPLTTDKAGRRQRGGAPTLRVGVQNGPPRWKAGWQLLMKHEHTQDPATHSSWPRRKVTARAPTATVRGYGSFAHLPRTGKKPQVRLREDGHRTAAGARGAVPHTGHEEQTTAGGTGSPPCDITTVLTEIHVVLREASTSPCTRHGVENSWT